jgi:hypothetical protein
MWVKASDANHIRIRIYDDVIGSVYSAYHTGGGDWEWLEVTSTIGAAATEVYPITIFNTVSGKTAYFSQPMLVYGSSIGEGNYQPIVNEVVWLEAQRTSTKFYSAGFSDEGATNLNIEADSNGAIPKGAKAINFRGRVNDSGSAAALTGVSLNYGSLAFDVHGVTNDAQKYFNAWDRLTSTGDIVYGIEASGASTMDIYLSYCAVQVN